MAYKCWTNSDKYKIFGFTDEIQNPVLVPDELDHFFYLGKTDFEKLKWENKEFMPIPGACHCDLYDNLKFIPFVKNFCR